MAGMDFAGPSKAKKTGLRRPKRRIGVRIDMTPMVDIAFLLLIFYMVTTLFSAPKAMEISLPPAKTEVKVGESHLLFLRVTTDGKLYENFGIKDPPELISLASLRGFLLEKTKEIPEIVIFVKIDKEAKYSIMVDIIDDIQVVESKIKETSPEFSSRFSIAPLDDFDQKQLAKVPGYGEVTSNGK